MGILETDVGTLQRMIMSNDVHFHLCESALASSVSTQALSELVHTFPPKSENLLEGFHLQNTSICYWSMSRPTLLNPSRASNNMMHHILNKNPNLPIVSTNINSSRNYIKV
jgi:hypothetical protein